MAKAPRNELFVTSFLVARKEIGLEINYEETGAIFMSCQQNAGRNRNMRLANQTPENVTKFKYLGTTLTYQHFIYEEIYGRLDSENACYSAVDGLLSDPFSTQRQN